MATTANQFDALVLALKLAITAPSNQKAQECIDYAEALACGMSDIEVQRAKNRVVEEV
tara:strand:- start:525 stop:698 length:174 start_codon:yes stop_codon:yes gene_type:complete